MKEKTIWIRLGSNTSVDEAMIWLLNLAEEGLAGEVPVVLVKDSERHSLSHIYDVSDEAWSSIVEKFGEHNVKWQGKENEPACRVSAYQMERIADSLECIAASLKDIIDRMQELSESQIAGAIDLSVKELRSIDRKALKDLIRNQKILQTEREIDTMTW